MCVGKKPGSCTELLDRTTWSRTSPLPPPNWIREWVDVFTNSVRLAAAGHIDESRRTLATIPNDRIWEWGSQHGKMSGGHRFNALGRPPFPAPAQGSGPRSPDSLGSIVFNRDAYTCRYCDIPVAPVKVLRAFSDVVGREHFSFGVSDRERTGIGLMMWAQLDHVIPYTRGGDTSVDNVVTSCWSCNYGKDRFTLEQLALDNPFSRTPANSSWSGLTECYSSLASAGRKS